MRAWETGTCESCRHWGAGTLVNPDANGTEDLFFVCRTCLPSGHPALP